MNHNKITNVADGEVSPTSKDAINGSQLYEATKDIRDFGNQIDRLGNRVDKVGAHAAALAALHPLDFDPDDKWNFAAGAFYRSNANTMFSFAGSVGSGENMWNTGVSKAQLAAENADLKAQNAKQDEEIEALKKSALELQNRMK